MIRGVSGQNRVRFHLGEWRHQISDRLGVEVRSTRATRPVSNSMSRLSHEPGDYSIVRKYRSILSYKWVRDGGDCESFLDSFQKAGIDLEQLAADLQSQGAKSFDDSWQNLLSAIES